MAANFGRYWRPCLNLKGGIPMRNLKRALSLGLTAAMISGLMVMSSSAASYADVTSEDNQEAIEVLEAVGIMIGDENGDFNPDQNVTRNEMAVVMSNLMEYNVASYKDTSPFTDVPSWAEPYVAACYTNGITAGTSATTYGGSDTVTTAQAALMLMKALGYFQYASDFGGDWQLATVRQGNDIDLFVGVDSGVTQAMTRNDVAQLVLNTLESGTVTANAGSSITVGDITITNDVKYDYITSGEKYAQAINDDRTTNNDGDLVRGFIVELGEQLYLGDLMKKGGQDDFGRPSAIWSYNNKEIGTYADEADYVYTEAISEKDLYNELGATIMDYTWSVYWNGKDLGSVKPSKNITDDYNHTATGTLTEVFVDNADKTVVVTEVDTFLAEVVRVNENDDKTTITLNYLDGLHYLSNATGRQSSIEVDSTDLVDGDKILVTLYEDGNQFSIASMVKAETATGTVTAVKSVYDENDNKDGTYVMMDGSKYNYVGNTFANDLADTDLEDPTINAENILYLDTYGNMIAFEATERDVNYLYVQDDIQDLNGAKAMVTFGDDGREETISVTKLTYTNNNGSNWYTVEKNGTTIANELEQGVYSYVKQGSTYELTQLVDVNTAANSWANYPNAKSEYDDGASDANNVYTIKNGLNAIQYTPNGGKPQNVVSLNNATIFVDVEGAVVYTGYSNVPTMTDISFYVVYNKQLNADVVFITDGADNSTSDSYFLLTENNPLTTKTEDGVVYREYSAWVDGEKTTVTMKGIFKDSSGAEFVKNTLYKIDTITPEGYITDATNVTTAGVANVNSGDFSLAYSATQNVPMTKTSNTIRIQNDSKIADCDNNTVSGTNPAQKIYAYNSDTVFMQVYKNSSGNWVISRSNSNAINTNDDTQAGNSNVYVIAVDDKDARTPVATLVYIVNQNEATFTEYQVNLTLGTNVTAAPLTNGGVTVNSGDSVLAGSTLTLTPAVAPGYKVDSVTVNGTPVTVNGDGTTYTIPVNGVTNIEVTAVLNTDVNVTLNVLNGARVVIDGKGYTSATQPLTLTAEKEVHVQVQWGGVAADSKIVSWGNSNLTNYGDPASTTGEYYFTPTAADNGKTLEVGVATHSLTLAAGVNATWTYNGVSGSVTGAGSAVAIPENAVVTLNDGTYYLKDSNGNYLKGDYTMTADLTISASDKYNKIDSVVTIVNNVGATDQALLGEVTATVAAADQYVKAGDKIKVTITAANVGTASINTAITGAFSVNRGATLAGTYSTAQDLIQTSTTGWSGNATGGVIDNATHLEYDALGTSADVTLTLTLGGGQA